MGSTALSRCLHQSLDASFSLLFLHHTLGCRRTPGHHHPHLNLRHCLQRPCALQACSLPLVEAESVYGILAENLTPWLYVLRVLSRVRTVILPYSTACTSLVERVPSWSPFSSGLPLMISHIRSAPVATHLFLVPPSEEKN